MLIRILTLAGLAVAIIAQSFAHGQPAAGGPKANTIEDDQLQQSMAIGALTLLVSRIAAEKINVPRIKEFALLEVAEQETLFDVMKSLQSPARSSGSVIPTSDAELEEHLVPRGREILQKIGTLTRAPISRGIISFSRLTLISNFFVFMKTT